MVRIITDSDASTSSGHGCPPSERSIEELIDAGMIVIDKPKGPNSHQVSAWARDLLGIEKLGHGGTLDPFATGVLVLLAGKSMRLTKKVLGHDKTYVCVLHSKTNFDEGALDRALQQLSGEVYNVPPEISAVKVQVRSRRIRSKLTDVIGGDAVIHVNCESGTYIRTLARDLGLLLGFPVELKELRRTKSGRFNEKSSISLHELTDAIWLWQEKGDESAIRKIIQPIESVVQDLPSILIKDGAASAIAHGASLLRPGVVSIDADLARGDRVQILTLKNELVAVATMLVRSEMIESMTEGEIAKPEAVFLGSEVYPRAWKKSTS
ncbi:MAG: RNA-guided pseudouridylation complex pseudouridine synthase subunit Cbf5 [Candidatus Thalassarchaeaceae archaeon]|jgi:H/ACA ribonucleoprotein complex subunit 4|nr:RNA-guided pseudouridylation complex pseudouridine synthase subunit Cbf5 [Candidatus Thalassarchaeaceae archaeon]